MRGFLGLSLQLKMMLEDLSFFVAIVVIRRGLVNLTTTAVSMVASKLEVCLD